MVMFFNFSPTSNHLHPLQVEICDSNSRPNSPHCCNISRCCCRCKILLHEGSDINHCDRFGATSLHISTGWREPIITQLLKDRHADCTLTDRYDADALHWAAWNGKKKIVNALLHSRKFSNNKYDNYENYYLSLASWRLEEGVVEMLKQVPSFTTSGGVPPAENEIWPDTLPSVDLYPTGHIDVSNIKDLSLPPLL